MLVRGQARLVPTEMGKKNGKTVLAGISNVVAEMVANDLLHIDVVEELNKRVKGWSVDPDSKCAYDKREAEAMVKYIPPPDAKALPQGVGIYCVFNDLSFTGCEIAAWREDATLPFNTSSFKKRKWVIGDVNDSWLMYRALRGGKDGYGMAWDSDFFAKIQNIPKYKADIAKELADFILELHQMLTN